MSIEQYENTQSVKRIDAALREAEAQAENDPTHFDFMNITQKLRKRLTDETDHGNA